MGFDRTDLLQQAGYSEGDVVPVVSLGAEQADGQDTTSTTFTVLGNLTDTHITWDAVIPPDAQGVVRHIGLGNPGTDETLDTRVSNVTDSEGTATVTGITSTETFDSGWTEYTPTTTSAPIRVMTGARTNPGANSSSILRQTVLVGVQL
jgi:hypothetical protein